MNLNTYRKLINDYNENPKRYNDREAEAIALMARSLGENFRRESKPLRKGLYEAGEMATLGLLPDSWEPQSRGESVFGQTVIDKMASGVGMGAGLLGGGALAVKGAKGAYGMVGGSGKDALLKVRQRMSQAGINVKDKIGSVGEGIRNTYNMGLSRLGIRKSLGEGRNLGKIARDLNEGRITAQQAKELIRQAGGSTSSLQNIVSNIGRAGKAYGQGVGNVATLQGMRAAQALANRVGIPYETAVRILQYSGGGIAGAGALDYTMGGFGD